MCSRQHVDVPEFFRSQPSTTGTVGTGASTASPNNWWFSWNFGLVHFVSISTEVFFDQPELLPCMWSWLDADLAAANANRTAAPWIVVNGHRPLYCSCDGDSCDGAATTVRDGPKGEHGLESLFYKYGVDLYMAGHEHDYERMYDVAPHKNSLEPWLSGKTTQSTVDMPATTYIISGAAGNHENPVRAGARRDAAQQVRLLAHVCAQREPHAHPVVVTDCSQSPPQYDEIGDDFWLVQSKHGPFAAVAATK